MENDIVIVLDLGQYRDEFKEEVPFKAVIYERYDHECWVRSLKTRKEYEVYYDQILEYMDIEEIKTLIDLSKYGEYDNTRISKE